MSVADGKLLELHERALNMVRAAVRGRDAKTLCWREPDTGKTIAGEVVHVCEAERFWLRDAGMPRSSWMICRDRRRPTR